MNLKEAREIARKVGATIEEKKATPPKVIPQDFNPSEYYKEFIVRLGVVRIGGNGTRENIVIHAGSAREAAELAVVETGRAARALVEEAKRVYVDSDLIFGAPKA